VIVSTAGRIEEYERAETRRVFAGVFNRLRRIIKNELFGRIVRTHVWISLPPATRQVDEQNAVIELRSILTTTPFVAMRDTETRGLIVRSVVPREFTVMLAFTSSFQLWIRQVMLFLVDRFHHLSPQEYCVIAAVSISLGFVCLKGKSL
jgi:hypothetical protein